MLDASAGAVQGRARARWRSTLREDYPGRRMVLPERERRGLLRRLASLSIAGGAVYDAMTAATAARHGHAVLSCDRRAASLYSRLDVEVVYL